MGMFEHFSRMCISLNIFDSFSKIKIRLWAIEVRKNVKYCHNTYNFFPYICEVSNSISYADCISSDWNRPSRRSDSPIC